MKKSLCFFRQLLLLGVLAILLHITTFAQATNGTVVITTPLDGASFTIGKPIPITAEAVDPEGYVPRVEFYETNNLIGVSTINFLVPPPDGAAIEHSIVWSNAAPGFHALRAVGLSSIGTKIYSEPVHIRVLAYTNQTMVRIVATDPEATKFSGAVAVFDSATFTVFRDGPTNSPLTVFMSFHGTAQMGVDYQVFPDTNSTVAFLPITILAGQSSMNIPIIPINGSPSTNNWIKTIGVHLEYSPLAGPMAGYLIDPQYREDAAVIYNQTRPAEGALEIAIPSGGERFGVGQDVDILSAAVHPTDPVQHVEFYLDGFKVNAPEVNAGVEKAVYTHAITWNKPPKGSHRVNAQAYLPDGTTLRSSTITFFVGEEPITPTVSIHYLPDMTDRPIPNADYAPGSVRLDRTGPTNDFLTVRLNIGGTATPGADYTQIPWNITIQPGHTSAFITVEAIDDLIPETNETVVFTIAAPLLPIPGEPLPYFIDPISDQAVVTIYDNDSNNQFPPAVRISSPPDGATFRTLQPINIFADAQSSNSVIQFIEVRVDGLRLAGTNGGNFSTIWTNPIPGTHILSAFALDADGLASTSAPVRININPINQPTAIRNLPEQYIPGRPFSVSISLNPRGVSTYAVEDRPPTNWLVSAISNDGVFDPITRKVKFGPYFDGMTRFLTYMLTPPTNAFGTQFFEGKATIGDVVYAIGGDTYTAFTPRFHPADLNTNSAITLQEVTTYGYAWKRGVLWTIPPNPIPLDYVTRAALIWRRGEAYRFDPTRGPAPLCWIPSLEINTLRAASILGSAERSGTNPLPGGTTTITIVVTPSEETSSYALVEKLPAGWNVSDISDEGQADVESGVIRWGPFFDANPRTVSYTVTAPANVASSAALEGAASFDGQTQPIAGKTLLIASDASTLVRIQASEINADGLLHLSLSGAPGQFVTIESSDDMIHWNAVSTEFLPVGSAEWTQPAGTANMFYRLHIN